MEQRESKLDQVRVGTPCDASWRDMPGSDQRRYCDQCDLHVHNLAAMQRAEAEALLAERGEGKRLCVRVEYEADGSLITADSRLGSSAGPMKIAAAALALGAGLASCSEEPLLGAVIAEQGECTIEEEPTEHVLMGDMVCEPSEDPDAFPLAKLGEAEFISEIGSQDVAPESPREMLGRVAPLPLDEDR